MTVIINGDTGISGVNGSAANPAIKGGDADTGIHFGTDTAAITTGGTDKVSIDSSGDATFSGTVKTSKVENANTSNGGVEIDTDGHVQVDGLQMPTAGATAYRNKVINGDMSINQRAVAPLILEGATNANDYFIDRFKTGVGAQDFTTDAHVEYSHVAGPAELGFRFAIRAEVTQAGVGVGSGNRDSMLFKHVVEANRVHDLGYGTANAKSMVLSFYINSTVTGSYSLFIHNPTAVRTQIRAFTINTANTWERKEIVIPGDTVGAFSTTPEAEGFRIEWRVNCTGNKVAPEIATWGALPTSRAVTGNVDVFGVLNARVDMTGVQLECGTKATEFEHRYRHDELLLCQRYFMTSRNVNESSANLFIGALTPSPNTGAASRHSGGQFPVPMRTNPTVTLLNPSGGAAGQIYRGGQSPTAPTASVTDRGMNGFRIGNISGGINISADAAFAYRADAELP